MSVSVFRRAGARGLGFFALIVLALGLAVGTAFAQGDDPPADDQPAAGDDQPAAGGDQPGDDKPAAGDDQPAAGDQPPGDQPPGDQPAGDQPPGDQPAGDQPAGDQPAGDQPPPGDDKPAVDDHPAGAVDDPGIPGDEDSLADDPPGDTDPGPADTSDDMGAFDPSDDELEAADDDAADVAVVTGEDGEPYIQADSDGDGVVEPDELAEEKEFDTAYADIPDEVSDEALDKRSEDAELMPSITVEHFRKLVQLAKRKVLARMEAKIAKKSEARLKKIATLISLFSLAGFLLLFMPFGLSKKYPGQMGNLFKYSGLAAVTFFVTVNLFGAIVIGMRSAQGAVGNQTNPQLKLAAGFFDTLDHTAERYVNMGREVFAPTLESLRGTTGVVFQDTFAFDDTIRENIRLGRLDATDAEVEAAARQAELHDFVLTLPQGYDTVVGERGGLLSGGQRQRLAIARALIRKPSLLVLDEATSALDARTERAIAATLDRVAEGRTTVAVTHRLGTVTAYEQIVVMADGRVVERGTHGELLALGGTYAALWAEQHAGASTTSTPPPAPAAGRRLTRMTGALKALPPPVSVPLPPPPVRATGTFGAVR